MNITKDGACNWANRVRLPSAVLPKGLGDLLHMQVISTPNALHGHDHVLTMLYEHGRAYFDGTTRKEVKIAFDPNAWAFERGLESY